MLVIVGLCLSSCLSRLAALAKSTGTNVTTEWLDHDTAASECTIELCSDGGPLGKCAPGANETLVIHLTFTWSTQHCFDQFVFSFFWVQAAVENQIIDHKKSLAPSFDRCWYFRMSSTPLAEALQQGKTRDGKPLTFSLRPRTTKRCIRMMQ